MVSGELALDEELLEPVDGMDVPHAVLCDLLDGLGAGVFRDDTRAGSGLRRLNPLVG